MPNSSLAACFARYPDTDKDTIHSYAEVYEPLFAPFRGRPALSLLEVGVRLGGSLRAWVDWFPLAHVHGIDNGLEAGLWTPPDDRFSIHRADSRRPEQLQEIGRYHGRFDLVIDDGSHEPLIQVATWAALSPFLRPGGLYVIEDVEGITHAEALLRTFGGRIIDRRAVKQRHDDILWVWEGSE